MGVNGFGKQFSLALNHPQVSRATTSDGIQNQFANLLLEPTPSQRVAGSSLERADNGYSSQTELGLVCENKIFGIFLLDF